MQKPYYHHLMIKATITKAVWKMNIKWDIKLSLHVERPGEWVRADQKGCSACSNDGNNTYPHQIEAKRQGFWDETQKGENKKYRCLVMTMTAKVELIATWCSNPASSSIMLAPTKGHWHHQKQETNGQNLNKFLRCFLGYFSIGIGISPR